MLIIILFLSVLTLDIYFEFAPTSWERKESKRFKEEKRKYEQHKCADALLQERLALVAERRHYVQTLRRERACM